jgi:hypothetical protein
MVEGPMVKLLELAIDPEDGSKEVQTKDEVACKEEQGREDLEQPGLDEGLVDLLICLDRHEPAHGSALFWI